MRIRSCDGSKQGMLEAWVEGWDSTARHLHLVVSPPTETVVARVALAADLRFQSQHFEASTGSHSKCMSIAGKTCDERTDPTTVHGQDFLLPNNSGIGSNNDD